jgi:hypothetical protein
MRLNQVLCLFLLCFSAVQAGAQSLAFEKHIPTEKIQELLGKPRAEKIQIIEKLGVVVREVEFANEKMLGQYLDLAEYPGLEKPEIRLAAGTDDWTLIHEYIHALIAANTRLHNFVFFTDYEKANADLLESWTAYRASWRYSSAEHQEKVLRSFLMVSRYKLEQLQQFELEEIAIENYLREVYLSQKPAEFSVSAFDISTAYLKKSGTAALAALKDLSVACLDITASYGRERLVVPASLNGLCTLVKIYRGEAQDILDRAKIRVYEPMRP